MLLLILYSGYSTITNINSIETISKLISAKHKKSNSKLYFFTNESTIITNQNGRYSFIYTKDYIRSIIRKKGRKKIAITKNRSKITTTHCFLVQKKKKNKVLKINHEKPKKKSKYFVAFSS